MRLDRPLAQLFIGIGGVAAVVLGMRAFARLTDDEPWSTWLLPGSVVASGLIATWFAWRGWRRQVDEAADARADLAAADGRFHAFRKPDIQVVFVVVAVVWTGAFMLLPEAPVRVRVFFGVLTALALVWGFVVALRDGNRGGRVLSLGTDGVNHEWYGLMPWDAIVAIDIVTKVVPSGGNIPVPVCYLALCAADPMRWFGRIPVSARLLHPLGSPPPDAQFGTLFLPVDGLNHDARRIRAAATSFKRLSGTPSLPGWHAEMTPDDIAALVERHRRTGTFPP